MARVRTRLLRPSLALGSVIAVGLVLVGSELLLRRVDPGYLSRIARNDLADLHRYSEAYGWAPKPGFSAVLGGQEVTINEAGYRGEEVTPARRLGWRRVVVLGDSIAFGYGVSDDATFAHRLASDSESLEVINFAVQGYGTDQALIKLEREVFAYDPDLVILAFCIANDFSDNARTTFVYDERFPKPAFRAHEGALVRVDDHLVLGPVDRVVFALTRESILYNRLTRLLGTAAPNGRRGPKKLRPVDPSDIPLTLQLIRAMHDVTTARGKGFLLLLFPDRRSYAPGSPVRDRVLGARVLADVQTLDLYAEYTRRGYDRDRYGELAIDPVFHLTRHGHALTAEIIREAITERQLLPEAR